MRVGGSQNGSGHFREEVKPLLPPGIEPNFLGFANHSPGTTHTELSWLVFLD